MTRKLCRWALNRAWLLVLASLFLPSLAGQRVQADGVPACVGNGYWDCSGPTCTWVESDECESEEEEGEVEQCVDGALLIFGDCEGVGQGTASFYECQGGDWVLVDTQGIDCIGRDTVVCYAPPVGTYDCWEVSGGPCEDLNWGASGVQCQGEYGLSVSVTVPCQRVLRTPYPRGLVTLPNELWLDPGSPAWSESWSATLDYSACLSYNLTDGGRAVRGYRIGLAWSRVDTLPPTWDLGEAGTVQGWQVSATWNKSSWGQPECGPGLRRGERLPAFPVRVTTHWTPYWRRVYQVQDDAASCEWRAGAHDEGRCECLPDTAAAWSSCADDTDGDGVSDWAGWVNVTGLCDDDENGDGVPDDHCWRTEDSGWNALDLTRFGYPWPTFASSAAGPAPTELEPNPPCNGICIPVVEVQAPIEKQP